MRIAVSGFRLLSRGKHRIAAHPLRLVRRVLRFSTLLTTVALIWSLSAQPWLNSYVQRTTDQVALHLDAAAARDVNAQWVDIRLRDALDQGDRDRVGLVIDIAQRYDVAIDPQLRAQAEQLNDVSLLNRAADCGACAYDLRNCPGLAEVVACNLPVELTPLGDVNALRRGAVDWWSDTPVDQFDVALASIGLAATGLLVVSGGSSVTVKVGTSVLRVGRRLGRVNARLVQVVMQGAGDAAGLRRLRGLAGDLAHVQARTSTSDAIALLSHVDDAGDAARMARVADAGGPATRGYFEVLGKQRVFRALIRFSDAMIVFVALAAALAMQVVAMVASMLATRLLRGRRLRGAGG